MSLPPVPEHMAMRDQWGYLEEYGRQCWNAAIEAAKDAASREELSDDSLPDDEAYNAAIKDAIFAIDSLTLDTVSTPE